MKSENFQDFMQLIQNIPVKQRPMKKLIIQKFIAQVQDYLNENKKNEAMMLKNGIFQRKGSPMYWRIGVAAYALRNQTKPKRIGKDLA